MLIIQIGSVRACQKFTVFNDALMKWSALSCTFPELRWWPKNYRQVKFRIWNSFTRHSSRDKWVQTSRSATFRYFHDTQHKFPIHAYGCKPTVAHSRVSNSFHTPQKFLHPHDSFCYLMLPRIRTLWTVLTQNKHRNANISIYVFVECQ